MLFRSVRLVHNYLHYHSILTTLATSREIEKVVIKERRRNEFLKIENSRLEKGLRDVMSAKRGSTAGSNDDEPKSKRSKSQI